jgi:flagellar motor switch protein FliN/FliY
MMVKEPAMSDADKNKETDMPLPELSSDLELRSNDDDIEAVDHSPKAAADLEAVFDVPVSVSAVLGRTKMDVGALLGLKPGTILELDRKVGEAIDIFVNNRLVARGEVVLVEDKLGVTMTEIIKSER